MSKRPRKYRRIRSEVRRGMPKTHVPKTEEMYVNLYTYYNRSIEVSDEKLEEVREVLECLSK